MSSQVTVGAAMRSLLGRVTTPLLPDDYLKLINPLWSARELRGRIVEVRPETRDSATLVIKPGWGFGFDYQPGQYIGIGLLIDGRWRWRSYSLTSAPRDSGARTVTVTVKAMPEGFLSTHLVAGVRPGTVVRLAAPRGDFTMSDPPPASVLFLTGGSGITPVMSMLRTMKRRNTLGDVVHLHSVPTADEMMFADELAALGRDHDGYRLTIRNTRTEGRLDVADLAAYVPDWRDRHTWACGPEGLLAAVEQHWAAAGLTQRLRRERFAAPRTATLGVGGSAAASGAGGGTVTFSRSGATLASDAATSILQAGEQAGVRMPFGCRMGICHTCVVSLTAGRVRDLRTGAEYEPGSRVQTCVTAPSGDCVVDI